MVRLERVSKSFPAPGGRRVVLERASLQVSKGMSLGILAPNGSGKTTLVNLIAGIETPDSGRIVRSGRISPPLGHAGGLLPGRSGWANARSIARLNRAEPEHVECFIEWLAQLGRDMDKPTGTWSAGMRSRFCLAAMLAIDFDLYLIDEGMPTTTDQRFNARAEAVLARRLKDAAAVIVSHQPWVIDRFCSHTSRLEGARITLPAPVTRSAMTAGPAR